MRAERLHTLPLDEARERAAVDAQNAPNAHRLETAVVDEPPDRLGMHAEAIGDVTHAIERAGVDVRSHSPNVTQPRAAHMGRSAHCG